MKAGCRVDIDIVIVDARYQRDAEQDIGALPGGQLGIFQDAAV